MNVLNKPHLNINASDTRISHRRLSNENSTRRNPINFNPHTQDKDSSVVVQISSEASRMLAGKLAGKTSDVAYSNVDYDYENPTDVDTWCPSGIFWQTDCIHTNGALNESRLRALLTDDSICIEVREARFNKAIAYIHELSMHGTIHYTVEELKKDENFSTMFRTIILELKEVNHLSRNTLPLEFAEFVSESRRMWAEEKHQMLLEVLERVNNTGVQYHS